MIENIIKINESQILINIKNNFCIIYERKNEISEKLKKELQDINKNKMIKNNDTDNVNQNIMKNGEMMNNPIINQQETKIITFKSGPNTVKTTPIQLMIEEDKGQMLNTSIHNQNNNQKNDLNQSPNSDINIDVNNIQVYDLHVHDPSVKEENIILNTNPNVNVTNIKFPEAYDGTLISSNGKITEVEKEKEKQVKESI